MIRRLPASRDITQRSDVQNKSQTEFNDVLKSELKDELQNEK